VFRLASTKSLFCWFNASAILASLSAFSLIFANLSFSFLSSLSLSIASNSSCCASSANFCASLNSKTFSLSLP
tara:strand:- start:578 stop:796 length:219 start_codon:yes stop_codon:yes gene_type:complete